MRVASQAVHRPVTSRINEKKYDWRGATVRALMNDKGLDSSDVPAKVRNKIGDATDTTFTFTKALIGKDTVYVHADDMLAGDNMDEGFIAANSRGVVVASGGFQTDDAGKIIHSSIKFDKTPKGL